MLPTLCELAGVPVPPHVEGHSLLPLLKNPGQKWDYPAITFTHPGDASVRTEKWHYIKYKSGDEELYNFDKDKMEWNNFANDPEYKSIKKELEKHIPKHTANYYGTHANNKERLERIRKAKKPKK